MASPPFSIPYSPSSPSPLSVFRPTPPLQRLHFSSCQIRLRATGRKAESHQLIPFGSSLAIRAARLHIMVKYPNFRRPLAGMAQSMGNGTLISPDDYWGTWASLLGIGAFGLWSERTKIGSMVSAALVSILIGLAASNLGIIPHEAPAYSTVFEFLLPLTVPLLLFRANLHKMIRSTGKLLVAFLLGSVATVVGTLVAYFLVPMRSLGQDSWKIAAALMGSYVGGAVNYIAISEALGTSPSVVAAGVAADNVICAIYFMVLFALASNIPREASKFLTDVAISEEPNSGGHLLQLPSATGIAVSFAICKSATWLTECFKIQGGVLPGVTTIVVILATAFPKFFGYLAPSGEALSLVSMQVFFAVIGASGSIWNVITTAPSIFMFALVQVTVHIALILGLGKLFRIELKLLLLASNANVGGPTTACGMATARGWDSLVIPAILVGFFGITIATFLGIGLGFGFLRRM